MDRFDVNGKALITINMFDSFRMMIKEINHKGFDHRCSKGCNHSEPKDIIPLPESLPNICSISNNELLRKLKLV